MNPLWGQVVGVVTVFVMVLFVAVCVWTWLPQHRRNFDALARLPMEDRAGEG